MKFHKYHGLGNDYIVVDPRESDVPLDAGAIRLMCDRNHGIGSDGILFGPEFLDNGFSVRIFNPDGSEAEKSGNGLRIFSRYLWDSGMVENGEFTITTLGGRVKAQVLDGGNRVKVAMGRVSFLADDIPVLGETGEVIGKELEADGRRFTYYAATIGNPHCVILMDDISPELAVEYGPKIENNPKFPNRTNVQFMKVIDRANIRIEIWERGAGYTLASGSSSTAAAAVACKLKLCENDMTVSMPGGELSLSFTDDFFATMIGPVAAVYEGDLKKEFLEIIRRKT